MVAAGRSACERSGCRWAETLWGWPRSRSRTTARHPAGGGGPAVRALLHDEEGRPRDGPRDRPDDRRGPSRPDLGRAAPAAAGRGRQLHTAATRGAGERERVMTVEPTVFVVDDDQGVRRSLTTLGRAHGLAVETYASAEAFLAAYDPARPGCLLLDVRLAAGKNGLDLQDELRRRDQTLPDHRDDGLRQRADLGALVPRGRRGLPGEARQAPRAARPDPRRPGDRPTAPGRSPRTRGGGAAHHAPDLARSARWPSCSSTGKRSKEIAASLGISTRTAEGHRRQVQRKMEVGSTAQLAAAWLTQRPAAEP